MMSAKTGPAPLPRQYTVIHNLWTAAPRNDKTQRWLFLPPKIEGLCDDYVLFLNYVNIWRVEPVSVVRSEVLKLTQMVGITSDPLGLTLALWHRNRTKRWWSCQDWVFFHLINKSSMSETSRIDDDQLVRYENGNRSSYYGQMRKCL